MKNLGMLSVCIHPEVFNVIDQHFWPISLHMNCLVLLSTQYLVI